MFCRILSGLIASVGAAALTVGCHADSAANADTNSTPAEVSGTDSATVDASAGTSNSLDGITGDSDTDDSGTSDSAGAPDTAEACSAAAPTLPTLALTVEGATIRDALGREVWLRGVNAGGRSKFPPYFPFAFDGSGVAAHAGRPPFEAALVAYVDRVSAWGLDVVRLPVTWEAIEPTRGTYDEAFLDRYAAMAGAFGARGIRVIVDMHQDVFSRAYCGDGFPDWTLPAPKALPTGSCAQWFNGYTTDLEVQGAFDRFWADEDGIRSAFADLWRHLSARLVSVPGVVAFEILNEPGWGTADPNVFLPTVLTPFYSELTDVIREAAPGIPILFDATGVDAVVASTALARPEGDGLIFAPHYYDPTVIVTGQWTTPDADYAALMSGWATTSESWAVPGLIGEFGIRATADGGAEYLRRNLDALDALALHGTAWEYSDAPDDWNGEGMSVVDGSGHDTALAAALLRVYPIAVSGAIRRFTFDADKARAVLEFDAVPGVTELAAPERLFASAPTITVEGGDACTAWASGRALVRTTSTGPVVVVIER